jgi:hypothetical protein
MSTRISIPLVLFGACLFALGTACSGLLAKDGSCTIDTDCDGDLVCSAGTCSQPIATAPSVPVSAKHPGGVYSFSCRESNLYGLSKSRLRLARKEISARHGATFESQTLRRHFEGQPWYAPSATYSESDLSSDDKRCMKRIRTVEKGYDYSGMCSQ